MNFYEQAASYLQELEANLKRCNKALSHLPDGKLIVHQRKGHYEFYCYQNQKQTYVAKSQKDFIGKLADRSYLTNFKQFAQNEIKAIKAYLSAKDTNILTPVEYLEKNPAISQIIAPKLFKGPADLKSWAQAPYDQHGFYDKNLTISTAQGHLVRSKSECIIANELFTRGITYRYESVFYINGEQFRPDFEIYTASGKHIIWEHLGLMNDKEYVRRVMKKIEAYIAAGFIPGVNLILTADEDKGAVINSFLVHQIISAYLL